jgi:uncharacterized protein (TIGR03118 family)
MPHRRTTLLSALGIVGMLVAASPADAHERDASRYTVTNLVSDEAGVAALTDSNLVNAWGMAQGPTTPVWVADMGKNKATLYTGDGVVGTPAIVPLVVNIPSSAPLPFGVTGQVFNGTTGFVVNDGAGNSGASLFIFDNLFGDVIGWSPAVPPPFPSTQAHIGVHVDGASFTGLAIATMGAKTFLYAADFHNGHVVVIDDHFVVQDMAGAFTDRHLPNGYAPFGIHAVGDKIYVTFAKQDANAQRDVPGPGNGFVDVFDTSGHLLRRLVKRHALNAPWGVAVAPDSFGSFAGDVLIGNFGDGRINAYDAHSGSFRGTLRSTDGKAIVLPGLWALMFGNGTTNATDTLLFSSGPDNEQHGLYGAIRVAPAQPHDDHHGGDH